MAPPPSGSSESPAEPIDVKIFQRLAALGDPEAQYQLGLLHLDGFGVRPDTAEAIRLHTLAAAQGHVQAQYQLSRRYQDGEGVPHDAAESTRRIRELAARGIAQYQSWLSWSYLTGNGVQRDGAESLRWLRRAADSGVSPGYQFSLGRRYFRGEGVERNYGEALRWFQAAADTGHRYPSGLAERHLALMYQMGFGVQRDPAVADYWYWRSNFYGEQRSPWCDPGPEAYVAAQGNVGGGCDSLTDRRVQWAGGGSTDARVAAANEGDVGAQFWLVQQRFRYGMMVGFDDLPGGQLPLSLYGAFAVGGSLSVELPQALLDQAEAGDSDAQFYAGQLHAEGWGVPQDDARAASWYRLAAAQDHQDAQYQLFLAYRTGRGVPQDSVESTRLIRALADQGVARYQVSLAWRYRSGDGVRQDAAEYVRLLGLAAEQEYQSAYSLLGDAYLRGYGVVRDEAAASSWYQKYAATQSGSPSRSEWNLARMHYYGSDEVPAEVAEAVVARTGNLRYWGPWERSLPYSRERTYQIALMYWAGKGVAQDSRRASQLLAAAAAAGSTAAQLVLAEGGGLRDHAGSRFEFRTRVPLSSAFISTIQALAAAGEPASQFATGLAAYMGLGVPLDNTAAAHWFRQAEDREIEAASVALTLMYLRGEGVAQNYAEAFRRLWGSEWATERGSVAQITTRAAGAIPDLRVEAAAGSAQAQLALGAAYYLGVGITRDDRQAAQWLRQAAERGLASAQVLLGAMYLRGTGVTRNPGEALKWLRAAAAQSNHEARLVIALMRVVGTGFPSPLPTAVGEILETMQRKTYRGSGQQWAVNELLAALPGS